MVGVWIALLLAGTAPRAAGTAAPIGYAQATGYFKKDSRPTLYQPLNLLDAREITSWCSTGGDPLADTLFFGFKGVARIDEVRIYTGNGFDEQTFRDFNRARKIGIKAPGVSRTVTLEDHRGLQAFSLDPPLDTPELSFEVLDVYPAEDDPDVPVCLTDVVFYSNGKPLNGSWLTQKLKYDRDRAALLGTWFGGYEGAPDRYLSFYYDDTYRMAYEPYDDDAKKRVYSGGFDATSTRITIDVPGKGKIPLKFKRESKVDEKGAPYWLLTFEGNVPDDLKQTFRSKR